MLVLLPVFILLTGCAGGDGTADESDGDVYLFVPDGDTSLTDGDFDQAENPDSDGDKQDNDGPTEDGDVGDAEQPPLDGDQVDGFEWDVELPDGDTGEDSDGDEDVWADGDEESPEQGQVCIELNACPSNQVCNLSLGYCQRRSSTVDQTGVLFGMHPPAGSRGDVLVIDGGHFFHTLVGNFTVKVWIGNSQLLFTDFIAWDENRLLVRIPAGASGPVGVQCEDGVFLQSDAAFGYLAAGLVSCDDSTPGASGENALSPVGLGPYASGFVDYTNDGIRIYYPAQCGGLRRPGVAGSYPLVAILHGNGAGHINYEYLGQLLASRGMVVLLPPSINTNSYEKDVIDKLYADIGAVRGVNLAGIHAALAGLSTTSDIAFICHSRGCGRLQELLDDRPSLKNSTRAVVFLGPVGTDDVVPGLFMAVGASLDGQSFPVYYNAQYNRQAAPKWKIVIQGGNHSLFADAKVYSSMDGIPTLTRQRQLSIVASFVVPLMERAFDLHESGPDWLDNSPAHSDYTVESVSNR
jgi:hypothetical protein